jgi:two-component system, NarL family, nitrate/nitrite response regulator NarL
MLRVLLFEDNAALRESLTDLLAATSDIRLVGAYPTAEAAERRVRQHEPQLVLMDIDMPNRTGLEALAGLRAAYPTLDVVMLTVFDDNARVFEAIRQGATGYLLKSTSPERLLDALRDAAAGGAPMTPSVARQVLNLFPKAPGPTQGQLTAQEQSILRLLVDGFSYKMIASELQISLDTVRFHIKNLYQKLHVNSATEAVALALKRGMV